MLELTIGFLSSLLVLSDGVPLENHGDLGIVGGQVAPPGVAPYQILLFLDGIFLCSGSIITSRTIVTAAHCFQMSSNPSYYKVKVGSNKISSGGEFYSVEKIIMHEEYDGKIKLNDIGIIILATPLQFSSTVNKIALKTTEVGEGTNVTLTGWGRIQVEEDDSPDDLQIIELKTISNHDCARKWISHSVHIKKSHMCTFTKRGQGSCFGDSGGPLIVGNELVAVVSFGKPCARGFPDVYARISYYISWIQQHTVE